MPIPVYILTTEGPVRIQRITREDPMVHSVICLDGRAEALPVSAAYEAFVRSPTGVVERLTGHGAYRMDVDGKVDEGSSWQLAAVLAHAAEREAQASDIQVLFATGEVDRDLVVRPVQQVGRKLARLEDAIETLAADMDFDPSRARVLVPADTPDLPIDVGGVPVISVKDIPTALSVAGIALLDPSVDEPPRSMAPPPQRRDLLKPGLAVIAVATLMFWLGIDLARWSALSGEGQLLALEEELSRAEQGALGALQVGVYRQWLGLKKPAPGAASSEGTLLLAEAPGDCIDAAKTRRVALTDTFDGAQTVCAMEIRGFISDASRTLVGRLAYWPAGLDADRAARTMRGSAEAAGRTWTIDFEGYPAPGARVRLVTIHGAAEVSGSQPWYRDLLSAPIDSGAFIAARDRLARLGYSVAVRDWQRN